MGRASGHAATEPAVDGRADAHDVGGIVRGKEEGGLGDVSGRAILPVGQAASRAATMASTSAYCPEICWKMNGVFIRPGMIAFMRMPSLACYRASLDETLTVALNFCSRTCL
jgi:hypothetical protein